MITKSFTNHFLVFEPIVVDCTNIYQYFNLCNDAYVIIVSFFVSKLRNNKETIITIFLTWFAKVWTEQWTHKFYFLHQLREIPLTYCEHVEKYCCISSPICWNFSLLSLKINLYMGCLGNYGLSSLDVWEIKFSGDHFPGYQWVMYGAGL